MNRVEFYQDNTGKWRWRYVHTNGNVLADSGQGYTRRIDALTAARTVIGRNNARFTITYPDRIETDWEQP